VIAAGGSLRFGPLSRRSGFSYIAPVTPRALHDKVIVIIGGTTGLGLSAAKACVAAGGRVVVVGRNANSAAGAGAALGAAAHAFVGDATDPSTAPLAIEAAVKQFARFDGLYHVAGGSGRRMGDGPLHECSDAGWDATLRLNLDGLFYSNRAAVRQFLKQGTGGTVLNMASVLAYSPSPKHFATHAYAAAKAAIIGMTRSAAAYYARHDVRFNVIAPALVETPMSKRAAGDAQVLRFIATKQPLDGGRIGRPEDVDAAAVYFLSDQSKFVTGQVLAVDGGWGVTEGQYSAEA
jgi:NAD(P)-dependent dehydrogenase (short-subunit alcohol dehydrogenase family)